ncbi:MAG: DegV family protein [Lachnospiraceae bacterium]|nr:DegV family protein [Lachnospiraceae bacterium]MEE3460850.1 DegV family protein [Lachnospiraceae bacterium]
MENTAVITDSNCGLTVDEAEREGFSLVNMPFLINGRVFYENVDLTRDQFFSELEKGSDVGTSQPTIDDVKNAWDTALKTHDTVVYIPMSSGLSGSCSTAMMLAEDYDGKVQVVNNQRISVTQIQSARDAVELAREGRSAAEIKKILETVKFDSTIYIKLDTLKYLKKGGRITPAAAAIGTALRLKPVLQIQGEKLDAYTIARTEKQAMTKILGAVENDVVSRFGGMANKDNIHFEVSGTCSRDEMEAFADEIRAKFGISDVNIAPLSLSVACHIGEGSIAAACSLEVHDAFNRRLALENEKEIS